jgi:hypothetical protein
MSDQNVKGKSKYESPILVRLGEMAKGSGACTVGSSVVAPACSPGAADAAVLDCTAGLTATRDCTAGTASLRACSAGISALPACTAGTAATGACTAGGHVA